MPRIGRRFLRHSHACAQVLLPRFLILVLSLILLVNTGRAETANVRFTSTSMLLQPTTSFPNGEATFVISSRNIFVQPFGIDDSAANHELVNQPDGSYLSEFATVRGGIPVEFGLLELRLAGTDSNGNLLPDHLEIERSVSMAATGKATSRITINMTYTVTGEFRRDAGEAIGRYTLTFTPVIGGSAFNVNGTWSMFGFDPAKSRIVYQRSLSEDRFRFELQGLNAETSDLSTDGATFRVIDVNAATLQVFRVANRSGQSVSLGTCNLQRAGRHYRGTLQTIAGLGGNPLWSGFEHWHIEFEDPNDTDANGVPEFTDNQWTSVSIADRPSATIGGHYTLSTIVGGRSAKYQWFQDGVPILGATSRTLVIDRLMPSDPETVGRISTFTVLATTSSGVTASDWVRSILALPRELLPPARIIPPGAHVPISGSIYPKLVGPHPITLYTSLPEAVRLLLPSMRAGQAGGELTVIWRADFARPASQAGIALKFTALGGGETELQLVDPVTGILATERTDLLGDVTIDDDGLNIIVRVGSTRLSGVSVTRHGNSLGLLGVPTVSVPEFMPYSLVGVTAWDAFWLPRTTARLVNLSTQGRIETGNAALAAGVVLSTPSPRPLLVRAIGPGLAAFGIADAAPATSLDVFQSGTAVAQNTGWSTATNAAEIVAATTRVGGFSLPAGSRDAANLRSFDAGLYTFEISGSGAALVEIYDAGVADNRARFVNLSTRGIVSSGRPMIAGFVILGEGSRTFLIRAVGAGLRRFGVSGALPDPRLSIYDGNGALLIETDNWTTLRDISPLASIAARVGAFPLSTDTDRNDAALYLRLPAGNYTAHLSSADGAAGLAIIEIYDVVSP